MKKIHGKGHRLLMILLILVLLAIIAFLGIIGIICWKEHQAKQAASTQQDYDAIIVLGAQVKPDGVPSVQLQWRLDTAYQVWQSKNVPIVACGAQGSDEPAPEAHVMRDYLVAQGVPATFILTDDASFNTRQNLHHAAQLLEGRNVSQVLIVTSDYHLPRAMALARDEGFHAIGAGSPTKPEYWVKNHVREALSWIKYWAQKYLRLPLE